MIIKVLLPASCIIAVFIEIYKKKIRENKFHPKHIWLLAFVLSALFSIAGYFAFDLPGNYLAMIYYTAGVYASQYFIDMKLIKFLIKLAVKSQGINLEDMDE